MRSKYGSSLRLSIERLERREVLFAGINPTVEFVTNVGPIELELLEDDAPQTVDNFLGYVEDSDFVTSIFHRLVPGFVLQGGGFATSNATICNQTSDCQLSDIDASTFSEVPTDDPVVNEFIPANSNLRGTVAMAKLGGDPDSATNQWFVNLDDNSGNLDNQNGGFTVFARVTDMTTVDEIADFPTVDLSPILPQGRLQAISAAPYQVGESSLDLVRVESIGGTGLVHGNVYLDVDGNGTRNGNQEGGRGGIIVYNDSNDNSVLDADEDRTTTDDLGAFHLRLTGGSDYRLRSAPINDYDGTGTLLHAGTIDIGRSEINLNFGTVYTGTSWHNAQEDTNVDGVNGVTPLDALLVINELTARDLSDPQTGQLGDLTSPPDTLQFVDIDDNGIVSPIDALLVINDLGNAPAAAAGIVFDSTSDLPASESTDSAPTAATAAFAPLSQVLRQTASDSPSPELGLTVETTDIIAEQPIAFTVQTMVDTNETNRRDLRTERELIQSLHDLAFEAGI